MKNKRKYSCDKFLYSKRASNQGARPQSLQLDYLPTPGVRTHYARRARNYGPYHGETDTVNGHCLQILFQ